MPLPTKCLLPWNWLMFSVIHPAWMLCGADYIWGPLYVMLLICFKCYPKTIMTQCIAQGCSSSLTVGKLLSTMLKKWRRILSVIKIDSLDNALEKVFTVLSLLVGRTSQIQVIRSITLGIGVHVDASDREETACSLCNRLNLFVF